MVLWIVHVYCCVHGVCACAVTTSPSSPSCVTALNSGVVLFRNNDWTRALLDLMAKYARGNWFESGVVAPAMYKVHIYM